MHCSTDLPATRSFAARRLRASTPSKSIVRARTEVGEAAWRYSWRPNLVHSDAAMEGRKARDFNIVAATRRPNETLC